MLAEDNCFHCSDRCGGGGGDGAPPLGNPSPADNRDDRFAQNRPDLVELHDIFLPLDYFETWSNHAYNEQYLLANPAYLDVQFCNYWTWPDETTSRSLPVFGISSARM